MNFWQNLDKIQQCYSNQMISLPQQWGGIKGEVAKSMKERQDLVEFTKRLRSYQTPWESKLWYHLRANRFYGLKFKRQVPIDKYIVDFCCQGKRLIIELDGGYHSESLVSETDLEKQSYLELKGYKVLRFWNNEIEENIEGVLETIRKNFQQSDLSPSSPHHLGRGEFKMRNFSIKNKSAQDIQDEIFRKMPAEKRIKLASDFSMFLLELNKIGKRDGFSRVNAKNRKNFGRP